MQATSNSRVEKDAGWVAGQYASSLAEQLEGQNRKLFVMQRGLFRPLREFSSSPAGGSALFPGTLNVLHQLQLRPKYNGSPRVAQPV